MLDDLAPDVAMRLKRYLAVLASANQRMNLIGDPPELWPNRHLRDALELPRLKGPVIDVGSGAGLPGLVMALRDPDLSVTLLESVGKKATFLSTAAVELELSHVRVLCERAEVIGQDPEHREWYHTATCRGLARPAAALELVLPLVAPGGVAFLFLGSDDAERFEHQPFDRLGGTLKEIRGYRLPGEQVDRFLAEVRKTEHTPEEYPRRVGIPKKRPLGPRS